MSCSTTGMQRGMSCGFASVNMWDLIAMCYKSRDSRLCVHIHGSGGEGYIAAQVLLRFEDRCVRLCQLIRQPSFQNQVSIERLRVMYSM